MYETIFISPVDLSTNRLDDFTEKLKSLITKQGGEIATMEKWGRRRLAYPISRHREGFYTYIKFKAPATVLAELTQTYKVSDDVIRQLTVKAVRTRVGSAPATTAGATAAVTPVDAPAAVPAAAVEATPTPATPAPAAAPAPAKEVHS